MNRSVVVVIGCVVFLSTVAGIGVGADPKPDVAISNVTVSPENPRTGDTITVEATIENLDTSGKTAQITEVALRTESGDAFREYARISDLGYLSPGSEVRVPMTVTLDEPGIYRFRVTAFARSPDSANVRVQYPVTVEVREAARPQVRIATSDAVVGVESNVSVRVANGAEGALRNVNLSLSGDRVSVENPSRVRAELAAGTDETFNFSVRPAAPGDRSLTARLRYVTPNDQVRTLTVSDTLRTDPLTNDVVLGASSGSSSDGLVVELTNQGDVAIDNVTVTGQSPDATVSRAFVGTIAPGTSREVHLNVTEPAVENPELRIEATYEIGETTASRTRELTYDPAPVGNITLTGVEVTPDGSRLEISGSASNLGTTEAQGVLVSVVDTRQVTPSPPNKEYFVGSVPASDFVSFEVYATVGRNVSTIPLRVSYLVEGERRSRVVEIDAGSAVARAENPEEQSGGGGGLLLPGAIAVVLIGAVAGIIYVGWKRSRSGGGGESDSDGGQ